MRFNDLRSIAHNLAASLASGSSELIGMYDLNVFEEAADGPEQFIEIDFLAGTACGASISPRLGRAIARCREVMPSFCEKHGVHRTAFQQLRARYLGGLFVVIVEDVQGRIATDTYVSISGARPRIIDHLGRIRTNRRPAHPSAVDRI